VPNGVLPQLGKSLSEPFYGLQNISGSHPPNISIYNGVISPKLSTHRRSRAKRGRGLGKSTGRQRDNGAEPWESAYGGIADQCAIKDQRRMSRVSKRSAGYREPVSDAGRELPSEHSGGLHDPAMDEPSRRAVNPSTKDMCQVHDHAACSIGINMARP
jgi:hypothetical protein